MPGIAQKISNVSGDNNGVDSTYQNPLVGNGIVPLHKSNGSSVPSSGSWSKHRDDVSYIQLQKYWCELTPQARQKLMRIHKQTLFEHARKNMYCSRCNGLLLEGFSQIVSYGKSLQQDIAGGRYNLRNTNTLSDDNLCLENGRQYDVQDPSVHPWGGLTTARDGTLTLLDGYLCSKSLKGLQNVFDSACARERERELLYPDACGGGNRGWISQGGPGFGRGHGNRETCALHTARLSVETLVDFWSALGEETRQSLLKMKEEDFIERLMYRFDSKRFCRDCRKNVIREFKELKELKRLRRDPRCTSWFCVADTSFQYEVSHDSVQADWHQTFLDASGTYHHFEWAIGTGEGKSDILEFENVGLRVQVQVNGLDLSGLNTCYITLRAWKKDGRCNELCVKAHALQGQRCVHCRLVAGDGFVSITRGESIRRFFEHAEEAEEEEDDDFMDKEGNELDGECTRPQKHAKSPELAREFLLDAATVIFKEQVEKAFREGTARQNAHSIFVSLALKLLEERVHVACKEIITLEKQNQLLEDEENEKREEEERKERRRTKEKEKKLRKKERLREKENRGKKCDESNVDTVVLDTSVEDSTPCDNEGINVVSSVDSISETGEATPTSPVSSDVQDDHLLTEYIYSNVQNAPEDGHNLRDWDTSLPYDHYKHSRRKLKFNKDPQHDWNLKWSDRRKGATLSEDGVKYESRYHTDGIESLRSINGLSKQLRSNSAHSNIRNGNPRFGENFQCPKNRTSHIYDSHSCSCNHHDYRLRPDSHSTRLVREPKCVSPSEVSKPYYHGNKYTHVENSREVNRRAKNKIIAGTHTTKKVWEPLDSHKKYVRCNSDSDVTLRSSTPRVGADESVQITKFSGTVMCDEVKEISTAYSPNTYEDNYSSTKPTANNCSYSETYQKEAVEVGIRELTPDSSTSSSSNCSSCLSEMSAQNLESTSSEECSQNSEGTETSICIENECDRAVEDTTRVQENVKVEGGKEAASHIENGGKENFQPQSVPPEMHNHYPPVIQAPTMGYYHHSPISWTPFPPFLFPNTYGYGFNGNAQFLHYGALPPPLLNHPPRIPVFQPLPQIKVQVTTGKDSPQVVVNEKPDKMDTEEDSGFSLFHFGGPVALSTGFKADPVPMKEGITTNFLKNCHSGGGGGDHHSSKKDSIEYNLFAASNSMQFSFL